MAEIRALLLLVLSFICVECAPLTGKALLCRDPDTGKLYPVNATWISSTFCGNYTCSLKKKKNTLTESLQQINVTNIPEHKTIKKVFTITRKTESDVNSPIRKTGILQNMVESELTSINLNSRKPALAKKEKSEIGTYGLNKTFSPSPDDNDRYLTEEEIHQIADVLHTVKKSDLDAIVEIYNIAREITKELDKSTDKELVEEAINLIKEEDLNKSNGRKHLSYWYDPMGTKGRVDRYDMDQQNTNTMPSVAKSQEKVQSYVSGLFASNDIGKLPYYYPVSNFQRLWSYTYPVYYPTRRPITDYTRGKKDNPCLKHQNKQRKQEKEKLIQTSRLLPYPFTNIHGLNVSDYHTKSKTYYNNDAWAMDYYTRHKNHEPNFNSIISPIPKAVLVNPYLSEVQDIEQLAHSVSQPPKQPERQKKNSLLGEMYSKTNKRPAWKTEQLSLDVLNDIRAHIDTSRTIKAYPWRKKMKLEKVGKVLRMDESEVTADRHRRSVNVTNEINANETIKMEEVNVIKWEKSQVSNNLGDYEAVLDIVTCETQTEPGFFRMGNMSQPYPDCCPQLVNKAR